MKLQQYHMNCLRTLIRPYRIVVPSAKSISTNVSKGISCINSARVFTCNFNTFNTRNMSQKSITSFFKITPKKEGEIKKEKQIEDDSPTQDITIKKSPAKSASSSPKSPVTNGKEKRTSKRQRLDSSGSEPQSPEPSEPASPPISSGKKKKTKRQRIESSGSEAESQLEDKTPEVKLEKTDKPKTYDSPKSKKTKIKEKSPLAEKNEEVTKKSSPNVEKSSPNVEKSSQNVEKTSQNVLKSSPKTDKSSPKVKKTSQKKIKVEKEKSTEKVTEVKEKKEVKSMNFFFKKENGESEKEKETDKDRVSEEDYNPAKPKYHPIKDACWSKGEPVPYLALAKTLEAIEGTSARLKIIEILSNYLRSVIALTPEDLLPSVYMCLNQLAPAYHSLELGIAETYLMKAIGQSTGRTLSQMRAAASKTGDLGEVAQQARAAQRTMFAVSRLSAGKLFCKLKEIAAITGQDSVNKKISMIQSLYIACRSCEAKYLIRSLEGKLRIGLAEQSVLQALALATTLTPPAPDGGVTTLDASKGLSAEQLKAKVDAQSLLIKTTYCECPNYELVIPALLRHGAAALPQHCRLTPGIPLKPMLAHPTKGISEVFNRFEGEQFTCEWKYDGERAQIHVPAETNSDTEPDLRRASVFSRNQENNTSKYPDVLNRLSSLLKPSVTSCVLDTEAVAFDVTTQKILPFQILSTRKRKDAVEADIKVQVCVFVFDLLYLNGAALVREPLAERRRLLHENFNQVPGQWQFATSRDCSSLEEVQQFLDESIKGSCEGLMVKTLTGEHARYDIARRSHNWLKLKKDYLEGCGDTIDVVVIGAYNGRGKRARVFGGFLLACYEPETEEYQSLCKIGTGFTDEDLVTLSEKLKDCVIDAPRNYYRYDSSHTPDVWLSPSHVWEVRCADLSLSPAHRAAIGTVDPDKGISLRFPRYLRERDDKTPEQATSARQIADMYLAQDVVKNHAPKHGLSDDFY